MGCHVRSKEAEGGRAASGEDEKAPMVSAVCFSASRITAYWAESHYLKPRL